MAGKITGQPADACEVINAAEQVLFIT